MNSSNIDDRLLKIGKPIFVVSSKLLSKNHKKFGTMNGKRFHDFLVKIGTVSYLSRLKIRSNEFMSGSLSQIYKWMSNRKINCTKYERVFYMTSVECLPEFLPPKNLKLLSSIFHRRQSCHNTNINLLLPFYYNYFLKRQIFYFISFNIFFSIWIHY